MRYQNGYSVFMTNLMHASAPSGRYTNCISRGVNQQSTREGKWHAIADIRLKNTGTTRNTPAQWLARNAIASPMRKQKMTKRSKDYLKEACQAHTNLNTFAAVISILEGGHLYGAFSDAAAQKIIRICQQEQARCLTRYDAAVAALAR